MRIGKKRLTRIFFACIFSFICFLCWLSISFFSFVFAQTDGVSTNSEKSSNRGNNVTSSDPILIKPINSKKIDSDQENIGREAMAMIIEITKSNILYKENKSSANLAFKDQKFKDREKHNKEMKEYNEIYNKKYLASLKRYEKMRGQHAGYSGVHSDYSAYLQQFSASNSR